MDIWEEYYAALGRFVDTYASAEDHVFVALQQTTKLPYEDCQAIFSGTRIDAATSFIKRLFEARSAELPGRLGEAFSQLKTITTTRDSVLHWGAKHIDGELIVSNSLRAGHSERTRKQIPMSPQILNAMTTDLQTIMVILSIYCMKANSIDFYENSRGPTMEAMEKRALAPWLYIPSQPLPTNKPQPPRTAPPEQSPLHPPSQG